MMNVYLPTERNPAIATAWMKPKYIIVSEISSHNRKNTAWFHLYEVCEIAKVIQAESRTMVVMG